MATIASALKVGDRFRFINAPAGTVYEVKATPTTVRGTTYVPSNMVRANGTVDKFALGNRSNLNVTAENPIEIV